MTERRKGRRPELPFLPAFSYIARPRKTAHKGAYMAAALPLKRPVKVGELVRRRLRELKRTPRELADAVQVSEVYISDLVAGRRPPGPRPHGRLRTDDQVPEAAPE